MRVKGGMWWKLIKFFPSSSVCWRKWIYKYDIAVSYEGAIKSLLTEINAINMRVDYLNIKGLSSLKTCSIIYIFSLCKWQAYTGFNLQPLIYGFAIIFNEMFEASKVQSNRRAFLMNFQSFSVNLLKIMTSFTTQPISSFLSHSGHSNCLHYSPYLILTLRYRLRIISIYAKCFKWRRLSFAI